MFLVGGFSANRFVQTRTKDAFRLSVGDIRVLLEPGEAVGKTPFHDCPALLSNAIATSKDPLRSTLLIFVNYPDIVMGAALSGLNEENSCFPKDLRASNIYEVGGLAKGEPKQAGSEGRHLSSRRSESGYASRGVSSLPDQSGGEGRGEADLRRVAGPHGQLTTWMAPLLNLHRRFQVLKTNEAYSERLFPLTQDRPILSVKLVTSKSDFARDVAKSTLDDLETLGSVTVPLATRSPRGPQPKVTVEIYFGEMEIRVEATTIHLV
ncbi:hypothetical protein BDK51DRAFT_42964 [Blyttiomyces helicus]|uniref:Uncharacterized protein n=1 Tax=Blyttiomyces helicus TaxID=388810 RepID=A0A4P9WDX7_9FUNG|nr:hypothetical protein BDK51DRAFT_42964 [Blyttiomyces helicus]|eukprot:RKO89883.1 hypothetical protein BDK51DRAFT_42964 [Blyttiomyces helicus]